MDAYSRSRANEIRMTDTHIYFWGSVLSNWHQGGNFKGSIALRWLVNKLESLKNDESTTIKVDIPPRNSRASQLILNHSFNCGEQFMMASKAWLFDRSPEATVLRSILASKKPVDQKALGRKVPGFNEKVWDMVSNRVVVASQLARAAVDPKLAIIYNTSGTRMFVEGSPYDNIWGVGVRWDDKRIENTRNWKGKNKLGECHRIARNLFREQAAAAAPILEPQEDAATIPCMVSQAQQLDDPVSHATTTKLGEDAQNAPSTNSEAQQFDVSSLDAAIMELGGVAAVDSSQESGIDKTTTTSKESNIEIVREAALNQEPAQVDPAAAVQNWNASWEKRTLF
jgi:ribA/ribD-fused uncharacterized protein